MVKNLTTLMPHATMAELSLVQARANSLPGSPLLDAISLCVLTSYTATLWSLSRPMEASLVPSCEKASCDTPRLPRHSKEDRGTGGR